MVDRIIDLPGRADEQVKENGFGWFLEGENHDYLATDAILIQEEELKAFSSVSTEAFELFQKGLQYLQTHDAWDRLQINPKIIPLIKHDLKRGIPHICGRMDLAGGVDGLPIKLIEFNADTAAIMPESAYFQDWMYEPMRTKFKGQFNYLNHELGRVFSKLKRQFPDKDATLLLTSLGYEEDKLNLMVIKEAAEHAGFMVDYADLQDVVFGEDGVFLESEEGFVQYQFVYKMVPWEFIMFEEPDLLDILVKLSIQHDLIVLNPAYNIVYQAKHLMTLLYELFPDKSFLLPTYDSQEFLAGKKHVRKVNFGRLGENIKVIDERGKTLSKTKGDFGHFTKIFQAFAEMYADEDGDIYQGSMYLCDGKPCCLSFRRRDDLIIDDDSEFVPHILF